MLKLKPFSPVTMPMEIEFYAMLNNFVFVPISQHKKIISTWILKISTILTLLSQLTKNVKKKKKHSKRFRRFFRQLTSKPSNSGAAETNNASATNNDAENANRVTYDEFAILVRRIDRMEYSIGNIVSRVNRISFNVKSFFEISFRSTAF